MKSLLLKCTLLLLCIMASVAAKELTLSDALSRAKANSQRLRSAEAQRQAADNALRSARAERFPSLSATAIASYVNEVPTLQIALPTGPAISRNIGTHETYQTDVRLSMPLFTGGRISSGIELASASYDMTGASMDQVYSALLLETRQAVINLYRADQILLAANSSLARTKTLEKDVLSLFSVGAADSVDLLELELATTKAALQVDVAETARHSSAIVLGRLIGEDNPRSLVIVDSLPPPIDHLVDSSENQTRAELYQVWASIASAKAQRKLARSDWFPSVAVYGGYSYGKPNLDRFNDRWNDYFTAGATLSWSLNLGGKASSQMRRADYARIAYEHTEKDIRAVINQEEQLAREQTSLTSKKYAASATSVRVAEARFRLAKLQLGEGQISTNRLIEIQESLAIAEAEKASALADYHLALSQFYYVIRSIKLESGF
jgi:outer membrane protein